ncbi:hypothetical protein Dda_2758 [Drechslerella dactyloides]|uniref:YMC020W-like alpha/beta hydrolase domain-containing protein n=1 Tax=Drechslerella dactyloides TaxID=74499 RepID=A0AAD6J033_DREDA|nr:hypothetical protein Dda_2758 [Drechslerella dactyloides]
MSRKRSKKPTTSPPPPLQQQNPSASTSTTSVTSQATVTTHHDDASATSSTMSKSAASALESTASVVHKVKTKASEASQSVAKAIPQRLPQNITRFASTKATASTQLAQETVPRTQSFSSLRSSRSGSGSSMRPQQSMSPMAKHLSPPKPTTQLTSTSQDDQSEAQTASDSRPENGQPPKSSLTGPDGTTVKNAGKADEPQTATTVPEQAEQKTTSSSWLYWWGTGQPGPAVAATQGTAGTQQPDATPTPPETDPPPQSTPPPTMHAVDKIKADNKTLQKVRSAENLGLRKNLNASTTSVKTAPPSIADSRPTTEPIEESPSNPPPTTAPMQSTQQAQRSSWLGYWYGAAEPATAANKPDVEMADDSGEAKDSAGEGGSQIRDSTPPLENEPAAEGHKDDDAAPKPAQAEGLLARGAAWVFWSKPTPQPDGSGMTETGEIAIAGSSTEREPKRAKLMTPSPQPPGASRANGSTTSLNGRPNSASATNQQPPSIPVAPKEVSPAAKTLQKVLPPNLLVPSFDSCYNPQQSRSWFNLSQVNRLWSTPRAPSRNQLTLAAIKPRVRKAVAIGVHGFFPMKLVQRVLGEPTGTSLRFATEGAAAIQRWADQHNINVDIEKIALDGEGRVSDRVEMLWKLLENKLDIIRAADFVLVCCHSQGTPVGVHLVARMIEYEVVNRTRVGIIGMAGINLGPFAELNSRILTGSAKELFEFSSPTSLVSQQYIESLTTVLAHGVKLVFVGSIDDQLVSLYSSTFSNISHPFIYRAVFVDGRVHAPNFISHVVGLALKLRNIGVRDHGIIRELSGPLAGSLYGGEGHSRIYDDSAIYDLGVRHTLETNTKEYLRVPLKVEEYELPSTVNPYILPWAMRGMLEERRVQDELQEEAQTLLDEFGKWHPTSKVLKDVKFRLEAIRSRL